MKLNPIIKWAGGKRQLLDVLKQEIPKTFHHYYEPFFGGGALFFELQPENATINDSNIYLINLYQQIKSHLDEVIQKVNLLENEYNSLDKEGQSHCYYAVRECFNECIERRECSVESASIFLFLNKACFNGIYRENSKGFFNVPSGRKTKLNCYNKENLENVSSLLANTTILSGDYADACKDAKEGDFVFFDPPYYDTFSDYQKNGFPKEEHERLANLFKELTEKNVKCLLTNSNSDYIKELYKNYNITVIPVKRMINRNGSDRTGEEIIVKNY